MFEFEAHSTYCTLKICETNFYASLLLGPVVNMHTVFWSNFPLKASYLFGRLHQICGMNCVPLRIMQKETVHFYSVLCAKMWNGLGTFAKIHGIKPRIFTVYAEWNCMYSQETPKYLKLEYPGEFETKIKIF